MQEEEKIKHLIGDDNIYNRLDENLKKPSKDAHTESEGVLNNTLEPEFDPVRRKILEQGICAAIASMFSPAVLNRYGAAVSTAAFGVSSTSAFLTLKNYDLNSNANWQVRRGLASQIGALNYDSDMLDKLRLDSSLTSGEIALLDSFLLHRGRNFDSLSLNLKYLHHAANENIDESVKALILSRIAIDNNALSKGDDARQAIEQLDISTIVDQKIREMVLDNVTAVTFNCIDEKFFAFYGSVPVDMLRQGWQMSGIDPLSSTDHKTYRKLGINSFAALQVKLASELQKSKNSHELSLARKNFISQCTEALSANSKSKDVNHIAKDFLYSLTRPAFHAYCCGDIEHARELIELYFGKGRHKSNKNGLAAARQSVLTGNSPNKQWMMLLEAKVFEYNYNHLQKMRDHKRLLEGYDLANSTIARAIPLVYDQFGLDAERLLESDHYRRWARTVAISMHRSYFFAITSRPAIK